MTKALYYPYVSGSTLETLKSAVLFFDKIYLINPFDISKDLIINRDEYRSSYLDSLMGSYIEYVSLKELLNNFVNDQDLCTNLVNDLLDTGYQTFCNKLSVSPSSRLNISNISEIGLDVIQRKYYVNLPAIMDGLYLQNRISKNHEDYEAYRKERLGLLRISDERKFIYDAKDKFKTITLPFEYAESLMINHALIVARDMHSLVFTDSDIDSDILRYKLNKGNDNLKNFLFENGIIEAENMNLDPVTLFDVAIPVLNNISLDYLIEFYHEYRTTIVKFRNHMTEVNNGIQNNNWDYEIPNQIGDTLNAIVRPRIGEIFEDLKSFIDTLPHSIKSSVMISTVNVSMTVFPGIGPQIALLLNKPFFAIKRLSDSDELNNLRIKNSISYLFRKVTGSSISGDQEYH